MCHVTSFFIWFIAFLICFTNGFHGPGLGAGPVGPRAPYGSTWDRIKVSGAGGHVTLTGTRIYIYIHSLVHVENALSMFVPCSVRHVFHFLVSGMSATQNVMMGFQECPAHKMRGCDATPSRCFVTLSWQRNLLPLTLWRGRVAKYKKRAQLPLSPLIDLHVDLKQLLQELHCTQCLSVTRCTIPHPISLSCINYGGTPKG